MNTLAGTGTLIRLILRRDRIVLPIWIILVALVPTAIAASFATLYTTPEALQTFAEASMRTPATIALLGFVYNPAIGGLVAWRTGLQSTFLIVPVSLLLVIRHTRTEEETGRSELLGSAVVGRYAPLTAALTVVLGANLLIAVLMAGGLISQGLPAAGSIVLGLSAASGGWVFAAVAAVAAQLTTSPRPARGIALAVFGLGYLLRIAGDSGGEDGALSWLSWLSPLGWIRLTRAFAAERWWVLLLPLILVAALSMLAYALAARRDLGAGVFPPRLGPASAAAHLRSPLALAWRLHRGSLFAWVCAAIIFGMIVGSLSQSISGFVDTPQFSDWLTSMGAHNAGDAFLFLILYILGQIASAYAIMTTLRLRSEESEGRADSLLATPVSRLRWANSHLAFAIGGPAFAILVLGLTAGISDGLGTGDVRHELPRILARTVATLPAIWVLVGLTTALYGLLPRSATAASWGALIVFLGLELGWELRQVGQRVFDISPFAHVHWATPIHPASLAWLTAIAAVLTTAGLFGLHRRDLGR